MTGSSAIGEVWIDGELGPADAASVSVFSHAVMRGTAVFDVLRVVEGPDGPSAIGLRPHMARFERSMQTMGMQPDRSVVRLRTCRRRRGGRHAPAPRS